VNLEQTTAILYALSVANNLVTPGKMEIRFWAPKWETIDFEDAETAVNSYYAEGGAYQATRQLIGPADVVPLAVAARNRRTRRPEILGPGCYEPDPAIRARLTATEDTPRALPSRFEPDITRGVRIEAGWPSARTCSSRSPNVSPPPWRTTNRPSPTSSVSVLSQ
jgi:hypothetical protein